MRRSRLCTRSRRSGIPFPAAPPPGGAVANCDPSGLGYYAHPDWLGSWRLASSRSRTETGDLAYSPYGAAYAGSGPDAFTGHWVDTPDNFNDSPYRLLAPMMDRWLSPDPAGLEAVNPANPQTWNAYAYVASQPLEYTDPSGLITQQAMLTPVACPSPWMCLDPAYWQFVFNAVAENLQIDQGGGVAPIETVPIQGGIHASPSITGPACTEKILADVNNQFGTDFTDADVGTGRYAPFPYPQVPGGTINIDIFVPSQSRPDGVSPGRYPVHWWTWIIGWGPTLHVPSGPGGLDSPSTLVLAANEFTAHIDSAFSYNPVGFLLHILKDVLGVGGHNPCP